MGVNSELPPNQGKRGTSTCVLLKQTFKRFIAETGGNGVNPICGGAAGCNNSNPRRDSAQGTPEEIPNENCKTFEKRHFLARCRHILIQFSCFVQ